VADRTVMLRIGANIAGLQSQMRAAQAAVADFSKKSSSYVERNSASINDLSAKTGALGLSLVALAGTAVTRFAQFDKAMSAVAATGEDARNSLGQLRQAAIEAGADTAFSAEEAANAIEELAKAGLSAKDILGGGLDGALSLAAAGGLAVADAAEIAATALTQFGLAGADVPHVADLLAAGAGKAQGGVSDLSQALNQAGLIASQTGLSIEETTAGLSAFASAGLLGSDAGTSFKTMLQVLSAPSTTAAKEMERLGIDAYDAQGKFIGLEGVAGNLRASLAGLTDEQKSAALATIFGADAVRAASVLYNQGAVGVAAWTNAVNEQGYAAETAQIQTDNLIGDIERLGGSLDSVFIQAGSGANNSLRSIVQGAEAVVDAMGQIPAPVLSATTSIAGAGGLALLGVAGLGKLAVSAVEAKSAITALGISTKTASLAAGALGGALAIGTLAFTNWAQNAAEAKARTEELQTTLTALGEATDITLSAINDRLSENQNDWLDNLFGDDPESLIDRAERVGLAVKDLQGYILGNEEAVQKVTAATRDYIAAQGDDLTAMDIRAQAGRFLTDQLDAEASSLTDAQRAAAQKAMADQAAGVATEEMGDAAASAAGQVGDLTEAIEDQWKAMMDAAGAALGLRDAQRQFEAAVDDARESLKDNGKTLDETTEKGRANQAALDAIASSGLDLVDSMRSSGASVKEVRGAMASAREQFIKAATSMGMSKSAANELADQLQLIPKSVKTTVSVDTGNAMSQIATLNNTLNSINGKTVTAAVAIKRYGQAAMAEGGSVELAGRLTGQVTGGTPGKDSVNAKLMPGEHVLTTRDVIAMGGQAGVYAFRAALHGGVQYMATGGAVGATERQVADLRNRLRSARRRGSSDATIDRLQQQLDDATSRLDRLRSEAASLSTALRRGEVVSDVTGGLSGAYGVTDELRSLAASGDVGRSRASRLRARAGEGERALKGLYTQAERAEKKLAAARDRYEELLQVSQGVRSSITGGFSLSDVRGDFDPVTGKRVVSGSKAAAAAKAYAGKAKQFAGVLDELGKKSGSAAIVQEVAGYGVEEGLPLAQSLLTDLPSLKSLSAAYADIDRYGNLAGQAVARAVGGGKGVAEAQSAVRQAEAQAAAIDKRIAKWGKVLGREMAGALGIKARAAGGSYGAGDLVLTGERGPELEFKSSPGYVLSTDATRRLAMATVSAASGGGAPIYNDNRLSVVTNERVDDRALLRFDQKRHLLRRRS
jgi:TP901 family phage tail tape measure protein